MHTLPAGTHRKLLGLASVQRKIQCIADIVLPLVWQHLLYAMWLRNKESKPHAPLYHVTKLDLVQGQQL